MKRKRRNRPASSIAAGLRSLAGHLYREARTIEPGQRNAYAEGLKEAALIASRRASRFEEPVRLARRKIRAAKKK
jgi:predicted transcriptional regulator